MTIKADLGFINIAPEVLADIAGYAAMSCFGVKGMTIRSVSDGIAHLLRRENMSRGVRITEAEMAVSILICIWLWNMVSISQPSAVRLSMRFAIMWRR